MARESPNEVPLPPSSDINSLSINSLQQQQGEESESFSCSSAALTLEEKFKIVRSVGEECIQEEELMNLLGAKPKPIYCDGFEPSGRMHIAQVKRSKKRGINEESDGRESSSRTKVGPIQAISDFKITF